MHMAGGRRQDSAIASAGVRGRKPIGTVRPARVRTSSLRTWIRRVVIVAVVAGLVGLGGVTGLFWYYGRGLPTVASLKEYHPPQVTRVVDRNGRAIAELYTERRTVVPMSRIPRHLVLCVLAAEDADFYRHAGLDYPGILRAVARDAFSGHASQGASTITQQIVKNTLLSPERTLGRKVRELILARRVEQELGKDEILHLYLNHINFGHGRYGVQEAAQFYFGKNVEDLTLAESSLIAGIPQAPARLSPRTHPAAARRRQLFVLAQLEHKRAEYWPDLSVEQIRAARDTTVHLAAPATESENAPEVTEIARAMLRELVGADAAARGGYTITTTIDLDTQIAARAALRDALGKLDRRQGALGPLHVPTKNSPRPSVASLAVGRTYDAMVTRTDDAAGTIDLDISGHAAVADLTLSVRSNPNHLPASAFAPRGARVRASVQRLAESDVEGARAEAILELGAQGAVVVIDPRTRDVLALVGGYDATPGFDRATRALRQPGSAFKPIVYALGIRSRRFTPASVVLDAPVVFDRWQPRNYEPWRYRGPVRLREGLAQSINSVAVRVIDELTPAEVAPFAERLGITTPLEQSLGLALGASEVRPIELVNAFATFAAGGQWAPTRIVSKIVGPDGRELALPPLAEPREVMTAAEAYVMTSMLTSVVETGTATAARRLARPAAGKTGTSNDARDAWFVGFTPDVVAGVWVGYDDHRPLGRRESGAKAALPVWIDTVRAAEQGRPIVDFPVPSGVVTVRIDPASGLLASEGQAGAIDEVFLDGTQPTETARRPDVLDPNAFVMEQAAALPPPAPASAPPAGSVP